MNTSQNIQHVSNMSKDKFGVYIKTEIAGRKALCCSKKFLGVRGLKTNFAEKINQKNYKLNCIIAIR